MAGCGLAVARAGFLSSVLKAALPSSGPSPNSPFTRKATQVSDSESSVVEPDLPIIDPHHHLRTDPPYAVGSYTIESLADDRTSSGHDVRATVFVDCQREYLTDGPEELRVIGETRAVERDAILAESDDRTKGLVSAIVSRADMRLGERVAHVLEAHLNESPTRFRGIRHMTPWYPGRNFYNLPITEGMMRSIDFVNGVGCLQKLGLSFDAWMLFTQFDDLVHLARAQPEAMIILNHLGSPLLLSSKFEPGQLFRMWRENLAKVAACPNVNVKIGGLYMHHDEGPSELSSPPEPMVDFVHAAIDLFSPTRCMFESNFPVDKVNVSYRDLWNSYKIFTKDFSREERESMFAGTAARTYRLQI